MQTDILIHVERKIINKKLANSAIYANTNTPYDNVEFIAGMQGRNNTYRSISLKMKMTQLYQLRWKEDLLFTMKRKVLLLFFKSLYICMSAYIYILYSHKHVSVLNMKMYMRTKEIAYLWGRNGTQWGEQRLRWII